MKRLYTLFLTLGLLLALSLTASGAGNGVRVFVDGVPLDAPASYISGSGTTMVPLRAVAEALGCTVAWDPVTFTVSISSPDLPEESVSGDSALVVLDPGHGGAHNGAEYGGIKEKDLNLAIAARTAGLLEAVNCSHCLATMLTNLFPSRLSLMSERELQVWLNRFQG